MAVVVNFGTSSELKAKFDAEEEVKRKLEEISDNLEPAVRAELDSIMQQVLEKAIELCPKDSGALASSINLESGTISAGDFYGASIYAGSENVINPKSGKPTSEYAELVHDGHVMRNGEFWEGIPFLTDALAMYESELEACIDRAIKELGEGN